MSHHTCLCYRITQRVVALLHIIPTDKEILELVDFAGGQTDGDSLPGSTASTPCASPLISPRKVQ